MAVNLVAADEMVLCSVKEVEANPPPLLSPSSLGEDVCQPPSADWNLDDVSNENDQSLAAAAAAAGFVEELVDGFSIVCFERLDLMQVNKYIYYYYYHYSRCLCCLFYYYW
ncbi:hypothetical protein T07_7366 [Trichinella nelsoni]|uniref:Uncharacterized protein n=1 Tax=Trichinella nelsoni TaxID=6336 RepID=A0A0V0S970_9BILA|nr:hypothetical protein T07_7366 [Trichinella nelsoni]